MLPKLKKWQTFLTRYFYKAEQFTLNLRQRYGSMLARVPDKAHDPIKYNDLIANCVILNNTVELSEKLNILAQEGYALTKDELAALSPYQTQHVKRFGHYELDLQTIPQPITDDLLFEIVLPDHPLPPLLGTETSASG